MPHTLHHDTRRNGVTISFTGSVSGEEIIEVNTAMTAQRNLVTQIWDFSEAGTIDVTPQQMHRIALMDSALPPGAALQKVALVLPVTLRAFGDMYERYSEKWVGRPQGFESRIFSSAGEAREWVSHTD